MKKIHYAWAILVSCCLIQIGGLGTLGNCLGLYVAPVCEDLGLSTASFGFYLTIQGVSMAVTLPLCGKIAEKLGVRRALIGAATIVSLLYVGFGFAKSVVHFYILGLFVGPMMNVIEILSIPVLLTNWFEEKQGFAMGLSMACAGVGGAIFNIVLSTIISAYTWRTGYICMGLIAAIFILPVTVFVLRDTPESMGMTAYGATSQKAAQRITENSLQHETTAADNNILKSSTFWYIFLAAGLTTYVCTFITYLPAYGLSIGVSMLTSGVMVSAAMIGNTLGAFSLGALTDKMGFLKTEYLGSGLILGAILLLLMGHQSMIILLLGSFVFGLSSAMFSTMNPLLVKTVFSKGDYGKIYSYVSVGSMSMNAVASVLVGFMYDVSGGYVLSFMTAIAAYVAIMLLVTMSFKKEKLI